MEDPHGLRAPFSSTDVLLLTIPIFEPSDLYAVVFAAAAVALIWWGTRGAWPLQWIGAELSLYGLLYAIAHDGSIHRRAGRLSPSLENTIGRG